MSLSGSGLVLLLHVEKAGVDAIFCLRRWVVEDAPADLLLTNSLFLVVAGTLEKFLAGGEALLLVGF